MKKINSIYQSLSVGMLLCAIGGGLDADSFLLHGHIFAGLQTGNLVLLGAGYSQLNGLQILRYVVAILAFAVGLIITRFFQDHNRDSKHLFPTVAILSEIILLFLICLLSNVVNNLIIIAIMSIVGAIQLQAFPKIEGHPFTPLMMMGHMKKTVNFMDKGNHERVITNVCSLVSFFIGTVITGILLIFIGDWSLLFDIAMLGLILIMARYNH